MDTTQLPANNSMPPTLSLITFALILVMAAIILIVVISLLCWYKSGVHKLEIDSKFDEQNLSYSTINRGNKEQTQPEPHNTAAELYDQIQLSPSTGQSEPIFNKDNENINIGVSLSQHEEISKVSETNSETENTNFEDFTYAVVDKTKKRNKRQVNDLNQQSTSKKCTHHKIPEGLNDTEECDTEEKKQKDQPSQRRGNLEEMYAVVHKKPKQEEQITAPPVPSHTTESLYTAIQKCK